LKIVGIVAEYNPFHNGHQYHIAQSRLQTNAEGVICVMSGNYVQRGTPALMDKWTRAEMALLGGADLILELPLPISIGSAEHFAFGAVSLLHNLGVVDFLSFGGENPDLTLLSSAALKLLDPDVIKLIKKYLKEGLSFPAARQRALASIGFENVSFLSLPNNILGVEYVKSLIRLSSSITPVIIPRHLAGYHDTVPTDAFASAQAVRKLLYQKGTDECLPYLPLTVSRLFSQRVRDGRYFLPDGAYSKAVMACMKKMTTQELSLLPDVTEGLENRIVAMAKNSFELEDFLSRLKTKRYTRTRLNRIVISAFLGLSSSLCCPTPPYARVLGLNRTGQEILKRMGKTASIPIITKPSHISLQNEKCQQLFALESRATSLYNLLLQSPSLREDMTTSPIVIKD
jgi:predicted nucleotidyltransferase